MPLCVVAGRIYRLAARSSLVVWSSPVLASTTARSVDGYHRLPPVGGHTLVVDRSGDGWLPLPRPMRSLEASHYTSSRSQPAEPNTLSESLVTTNSCALFTGTKVDTRIVLGVPVLQTSGRSDHAPCHSSLAHVVPMLGQWHPNKLPRSVVTATSATEKSSRSRDTHEPLREPRNVRRSR